MTTRRLSQAFHPLTARRSPGPAAAAALPLQRAQPSRQGERTTGPRWHGRASQEYCPQGLPGTREPKTKAPAVSVPDEPLPRERTPAALSSSPSSTMTSGKCTRRPRLPFARQRRWIFPRPAALGDPEARGEVLHFARPSALLGKRWHRE